MGKNLGFRAWFYFRQGWSTYFAFIFAAINTLTVTYYLAIENLPVLKQFFPSFILYLITVSVIGIPVLVSIGYVHYKRSSAYKAEAAINIESNPYIKRLLSSMEVILLSHLKTTQLLSKLSKNEKLSSTELDELSALEKLLASQIDDKLDIDLRKRKND